MTQFLPSYCLLSPETLMERKTMLDACMEPCRLCPRQCKVMRRKGETGFCQTGINPVISSYGPHHGEESPISGINGSGTIFFTGCTLGCIFCQNYDISHGCKGTEISIKNLSEVFLSLEKMRCHNINLVTPTHHLPSILSALILAIPRGLRIPLVYNSSGYERVEILQILNGIIDIYMPDLKFWDPKTAKTLCGAQDYPKMMKAAIKEMHNQVGDLQITDGIARRGLLIRHLLMPGLMQESKEIFRFISEEISANTWVNIMDQYHPAGIVSEISSRGFDLMQNISSGEWKSACRIAKLSGLHRIYNN